MLKIGVLALQGSVIEHIKSLSMFDGVLPVEVRTIADLNEVSGLIMPGGESTAMGKLMRDFNLLEPLKKRAIEGMPIWGTCAGMILLAKKIIGEDKVHLGVMDIEVKRNAYGSQLDSFIIDVNMPKVADSKVKAVFIRAPWVENVNSNVKVIGEHEGRIVAVEQENLLGTSFHPELTNDLKLHKYFINKVKNFENKQNCH